MAELDETIARVRAAFDGNPWQEWERLEVFPRSKLEFLIVSAALTRHLPPPGPSSHILDAGGGPGRYTAVLAEQGHAVTLLDVSPKLLAIAQRRVPS